MIQSKNDEEAILIMHNYEDQRKDLLKEDTKKNPQSPHKNNHQILSNID